jgi:hypothetical protein
MFWLRLCFTRAVDGKRSRGIPKWEPKRGTEKEDQRRRVFEKSMELIEVTATNKMTAASKA